ncbi:MAG: hypothetical protein LBD20_03090 [Spirochaetaceae bacterium]|jgi:hypothetical protein|nr:hypothetical protein [Spirochaetaceae bacterium]
MRRFFYCKLPIALLGLLFLGASGGEISPQFAVAQKYADWAQAVLARQDYEKALVFLERARDYVSSSSDLSYMLALTRRQCGKSADSVLHAALLALETDNWNNFKNTDALFLSAQMYVRLRQYDAALAALAECAENAETSLLRLSALHGAAVTEAPPGRASVEFRRRMLEALQKHPFNGEFSRMALLWAARQPATEADAELVSIALKGDNPAYLSAPFLGDEEAARHALRVWYAEQKAVIPESLPALLNYGVIGEEHGLNALFGGQRIDAAHIRAVFGLLRSDAAREDFRSRINRFTGTIYEDYDDDGYVEAHALYQNGILQSFTADVSQNGHTDIEIDGEAGLPVRARLGFFPIGQRDGFEPVASAFTEIVPEKHTVIYSAYPAVAKIAAQSGGLTFYFRPSDFYIKPVDFEDLGGPFGLPFPKLNADAGGRYGRADGSVPGRLPLSEAALWDAAYRVEAAGKNFDGGLLVIALNDGLILSAKEYVNGVLACEDFFTQGRLRERRIDMDLDGKLETKIQFGRQVFPFPVDYLEWDSQSLNEGGD